MMNQKAAAKNNQRQADIAAAQTAYSPWTGIKPQGVNTTPTDEMGGALTGAVQGGLAGLMHNQANAGKMPAASPGGDMGVPQAQPDAPMQSGMDKELLMKQQDPYGKKYFPTA